MKNVLPTLLFLTPVIWNASPTMGGEQLSAPLWSLAPVSRPQVPDAPGSHGDPEANAIDAFIAAGPAADAVSPAPAADRRSLMRRASYDLTGLPPTVAQVEAFVSDPRPDAVAFRDVVEALLASPAYGEHWGRHWLDVVRYADTAGENSDHPLPHAWRYRNWVIEAFNSDLPYDRFVEEQLAGDILAAQEASASGALTDGIVATGYLAIARRFGHDIDKSMHLTFEDAIDNLGKAFLGLSISCARCHDHKHDPVSARDYYALYGVLESTRMAFPGCEPEQQPRDLVPLASAEVQAQRRDWEQQRADFEAARDAIVSGEQAARSKALGAVAAQSARILSEGDVPDGGAVDVSSAPIELAVRKGEAVQLEILPRGNHGADTTIVDFAIGHATATGDARTWSVADLIDTLTAGNPHPDDDDARWCFLDTSGEPDLLLERHEAVDGHPGLRSWTTGGTPSVFVNSSLEPVKAWTSLPPRTFFAHPGPAGPVAIAWLSPVDGVVSIRLQVSDGHPGGDGVGWRLAHLADPAIAGACRALGKAHAERMIHEARLAGHLEREPTIPVAYAVTEGDVKNARLHQRGDPENPGEEVPRAFLSALGGGALGDTQRSGRLDLARRIASRDNPLTARVMVNRIWAWHFGRGIVATPNDFGNHGAAPTHPQLLDYLAGYFMDHGWSIKAVNRLVMSSATYRRAAGDDGAAARYAAFGRRRMTAEELRDTLLVAAGDLDRTRGAAHPFPPESSWSFTQHNPFADEYETRRRSVYLMRKRNRATRFFALFNGADPNTSTAVRDTTTVPTQALYFMNDPFFHDSASMFARRIREQAPESRARLDFACRTLFARPVTEEEIVAFEAFAESRAESSSATGAEREADVWDAWARILLGSNELLHLD